MRPSVGFINCKWPPLENRGGFVAAKTALCSSAGGVAEGKRGRRDKLLGGGRSVAEPFALGAKTENCVCGWVAVTGI
jgi:hypothetical protein